MTPERWLRLEELFDKAVEMDSERRAAYLDQACAADIILRRQVESLIISGQEAGSFIEAAIHNAAGFVADSEILPAAEQRIGSYKLVRELGRGGMGAVYLATRDDDEYQKQVAIKLVRTELGSSEMLRRFRSERQILADLDHPNIARLLDGGTTGAGGPFVVMEYIEGEPIDEYCDRNSLTTAERLKLFRKVCSAVEYAHKNLVIHRDIKPGNILVTADGEPKLLDFGIAKLLKTDQLLQTAVETRAGVRMMTPEYASPEQVRGEATTTVSDVYSLGVVLYELLTGHRPYRFKTYLPQEIERVICEQEPEKPSTAITHQLEIAETGGGASKNMTAEAVSRRRACTTEKLRRQLSGDLDRIVLMAMRKEAERRYSSVEQFSEDIRRHLEGLPVIARGDRLSYRAQKFVERHRAGVIATAAVILLIAALIGFYTARLASERDRAQLEATKAEKVSEFLTGLFEVADPGQSKGETITAKELLDRGAKRIEQELADQPDIQAEMMTVIGNVYRNLGSLDESKLLLEKGLEIRRRLYGNKHPHVAASLNSLGNLLREKGDYDEAQSLIREALAIRRDLYGPRHPEIVGNLNDLATSLYFKSDYAAAEPLFREAIEMGRDLFGREHREVAKGMNELGLLLKAKGDYESAGPLLRESLSIRRKLLGEDHTDVSDSLFNLAQLLELKGDYMEAEQTYRQALSLDRKLYGERHPYVCSDLTNLARLLHIKGDFEASEPLFRQSLEMRRGIVGEEHPDIATDMHYLASLLLDEGKLDEAESLFRQALTMRRKILSPKHRNVADSLNNLAVVFLEKGDYQKAEPLLKEALETRREVQGESHTEVAQCLTNLARIKQAEGDMDEAGRIYSQALEINRRALPAGHPTLAFSLTSLGRFLTAKGEAQAAEAMLREALEIRQKSLPAGHWRIAEAESLLGACLAESNNLAEAEPLLLQSYETLKSNRGERNKTTMRTLSEIIKLYEAWGKPAKAAEYRRVLGN
ncbi:MAG: serine/threonine-protein kinase [Blastocatellia bacterium]|nr:serine/threonine-protein kinase [Blastocatellia bacterium]